MFQGMFRDYSLSLLPIDGIERALMGVVIESIERLTYRHL